VRKNFVVESPLHIVIVPTLAKPHDGPHLSLVSFTVHTNQSRSSAQAQPHRLSAYSSFTKITPIFLENQPGNVFYIDKRGDARGDARLTFNLQ
jgi:hypothetical protein